MNTIQDYNEHLNASYQIEDKFKLWSGYRNKVTDLCLKQGLLRGEVAIFGAGNLNDLDLNRLLQNDAHLTLYDCDGSAMRKGIIRQGYKGIVAEKVLDLTGLDEMYFFPEMSVLMSYRDIAGVERYLENIRFRTSQLVGESRFDTILISPMYTQLLLPQFLDLVDMTDMQSHMDRLIEAVLAFLVRLIANMNRMILDSLKLGGRCIAWADILEYASDDPAYRALGKSQEALKKNVSEYEKRFGPGLGSYGLSQLSEGLKDIQEHWLIWPFDEERHLLTRAIQGVKKDSNP